MAKLETISSGKAEVKNGTAHIILIDSSDTELRAGLTVRIDQQDCYISEVTEDVFGRKVAFATVGVNDGIYDVQIVTESISPIRFIFD